MPAPGRSPPGKADGSKRHPSLRKLSDDHHGGLGQARRLRRAGAGEAEPGEAARGFLRFWEKDTSPHFGEEEEVLLAICARHGRDLQAGPIQEMPADHARVRGLVMKLAEEAGGDPATLQEIGVRLGTEQTLRGAPRRQPGG